MINVGIDLVQISRMEQSLKNPRFLTRVFSEAEQAFLCSGRIHVSSAAAGYAVKEAFSKALGTGVRGFSLNEVSVLRDEKGAPVLSLSGRAKELADAKGLTFRVSISHDADTACAMVLALSGETGGASLPPLSGKRVERLKTRFGERMNHAVLIDRSFVSSVFPERGPYCHKGSFGTLTVVAGSLNYRGAAALCTEAALRSGAGIVTLASTEEVVASVSSRLYEATYFPLPADEKGRISSGSAELLAEQVGRSTALLIGCGLGQSEGVSAAVRALLETAGCPVILDADGINAIAGRIDILRTANGKRILTPHPGEMSRLCGKSAREVTADPIGCAADFAKQNGVIVVLKDADTVVAAPDGSIYLNTTGNAGLARGGSGDLLSGIIAAFAAQGMPLVHAAACGVYLHGLAADVTAAETSMLGMLPHDLLDRLPRLYHFAEEKE